MKRGAALRPALVQKRQTVQQEEQKDKGIGRKRRFEGEAPQLGQNPSSRIKRAIEELF